MCPRSHYYAQDCACNCPFVCSTYAFIWEGPSCSINGFDNTSFSHTISIFCNVGIVIYTLCYTYVFLCKCSWECLPHEEDSPTPFFSWQLLLDNWGYYNWWYCMKVKGQQMSACSMTKTSVYLPLKNLNERLILDFELRWVWVMTIIVCVSTNNCIYYWMSFAQKRFWKANISINLYQRSIAAHNNQCLNK